VFVGDSIRPAHILGDFCIDPQHRTLGLALQLQRVCLDELGASCSWAAYDFPGARMMAIYQRMNISPSSRMVRWSKPLRVNRKIRNLGIPSALVGIIASPLNTILEWKDGIFLSNDGWTITEHQRDCGREFTELAYEVGSRYGICVARSSEYLNWRYLRHPSVRFELMTARRGKDLMGYLVFCRNEEDARIVDLFGFSSPKMWTALLAQLLERLRAQAAITLSVPVLATDPRVGVLRKLGFHPREDAPIIVCPGGDAVARGNMTCPWYLMDGDRES
jgi:hypothetical protein